MSTESNPMEVKKRKRRMQSNDDAIQRLENYLKERLEAAERYNDQTYVRKNETGGDVPIHHFLANNVGVVGLKEAVTLNHRPLKIVWIILVLGGAAATAYYIIDNTIEFLNKEPATKISLQHSAAYEIPPLVICPPWFFDKNNKFADLSTDALKYSLLYVNLAINYDLYGSFDDNLNVGKVSGMSVSAFPEAAAKMKRIRADFYSFYERHKFSSLVNYYNDLASDMLIDSYVENATLKVDCNGCNATQQPEKIVFSDSICYAIHLDMATPQQSEQTVDIHLKNTENSGGVLSQSKNTWLMGFMPNVGPRGPTMQLVPYTRYDIKLSAQRMISLVNASNCVDTDTNPTYDQRLCTEICIAKQTCEQTANVKRCRSFALSKNLSEIKNTADSTLLFVDYTLPIYAIWESDFKETVPNPALKQLNMVNNASNLTIATNNRNLIGGVDENTAWLDILKKLQEWRDQPDNRLNATALYDQVNKSLTAWESSYGLDAGRPDESLTNCYQSCLPACDRMIYDITLDHDKMEDVNKQSNQSVIRLVIRHSGVFIGIVVWKEVILTTFSEFVAGVGGTLGLFLGCTVLTVAQLILSFVNYCLDRRALRGRKCDPPAIGGLAK